MAEQDEGKIGPGRLAFRPLGNRPSVRAQERLFGDHSAGRDIEVGHEIHQIRLDPRLDADLSQNRGSDARVPSTRRQDQRDGIRLRHGSQFDCR